MKSLAIRLLLAWTLLGLAGASFAQDAEEAPDDDIGDVDNAADSMAADIITQVVVKTRDEHPVLDGVLDEEFWQDIEPQEIAMELYPQRFTPAIVSTQVLAASTPTTLYLGFIAYDPEISELRSTQRAHDTVKDGDYVSLVVDPTGNLRRKFEFRVNPHGTRTDVLQDTISNRYIYDWDTRWDSAATIGKSGYVVEMQIPFESIRQPVLKEGEKPRWVVVLKRSYPREVDRTFGSVFTFEKDEALSSRTRQKRIELKPHLIYHRDEDRDGPGEDFVQTDDHERVEVGLDGKFVFNSGMSLAATINPNYTDVEADIARDSINNPFTPFQPEKRDFFQDSREVYTTYMPVVYTRNIVSPDYGLDLSRIGHKTTSGALWVSDRDTKLVMPDNLGSETVDIEGRDSNNLAMRYMTGTKGTGTGFLGTFREGTDYYNYVMGIDGLINLGLDDKVRYQVTWSQTEYPEDFANDLCEGDDCTGPPPEDCLTGQCDYTANVLRANPNETLDGHGLRVQYKHDGPEGLYWVNYLDYAEGFRADFGLEKRTDYRQLNAAYGKKWYVNARKKDRGKSRIRAYIVGNRIQSADNVQIENGLDFFGEFRGSFQTVFRAGWRFKERAVNRINQNTLSLEDNAPLFDESYLQWYYETSPRPAFIFNLDGRYGDIADAQNLVLGEMMELKPKLSIVTGAFRFSVGHTYRNFDQDDTELWQENFTTVQAAWFPSERNGFRFLLLRDKTDRDVDRFLADELAFEKETAMEFTYLRRNPRGLSILAGLKLEREDDSDTNNEFTSNRQVYIKFVYDFGRGIGVDQLFDASKW